MIESSRRSALIFELNSILNNIDSEVKDPKSEVLSYYRFTRETYFRLSKEVPDDVIDILKRNNRYTIFETEDYINAYLSEIFKSYTKSTSEKIEAYKKSIKSKTEVKYTRLSRRLNGRVVALSRSLRPYRYLSDNGMLTNPISPERGQLLISLVASGVDLNDITVQGNFTNADLRFADFSFSFLRSINLAGSDLRNCIIEEADFRDTDIFSSSVPTFSGNMYLPILEKATAKPSDISNSKLMNSRIINSHFQHVNLTNSDLSGSDLSNTSFYKGSLIEAKLTDCIMYGCNLSSANLTNANLQNSVLPVAEFFDSTDLDGVNLEGALAPNQDWLEKVKKVAVDFADAWKLSSDKDNIGISFHEGYRIKRK